MYTANAASASGQRFRPVRGLVAGLVSAGGALSAHAFAGGSVDLVPGLMVLAVAIPMATTLSRVGTVDIHRLAATALVAQLVGHLTLMMAPSGMHQHGHAAHGGDAAAQTGAMGAMGLSPTMVLAHLAVVAATTAVAIGLDRALIAAAWSVLGWLLLPSPGHTTLPIALRQHVPNRGMALSSQVERSAAEPRGPPSAPLLPLLTLRTAY